MLGKSASFVVEPWCIHIVGRNTEDAEAVAVKLGIHLCEPLEAALHLCGDPRLDALHNFLEPRPELLRNGSAARA